MVFFCIFVIVLLIFCLGVMNLGNISFQKIKMQNTADFGALTAATWQARAMNIEGTLNSTVTFTIIADIIVRIWLAIPPPPDYPPWYIDYQLKAQKIIQESFNRWYAGTILTLGSGWQNGGFVFPCPTRVPLYVYRYDFTNVGAGYGCDQNTDDADEEISAEDFVKHGKDEDQNHGEVEGKKKVDYTAEDGLVKFSYDHTLSKDIFYPKNDTDKVPIYLGTEYSFSLSVLDESSKAILLDGLSDALINVVKTEKLKGVGKAIPDAIREQLEERIKKGLEDLKLDSGTFLGLFDKTMNVPLGCFEIDFPDSSMVKTRQTIRPSIEIGLHKNNAAELNLLSKCGPFTDNQRFDARLFSLSELVDTTEPIYPTGRYYDSENKEEFWEDDIVSRYLFSDNTICTSISKLTSVGSSYCCQDSAPDEDGNTKCIKYAKNYTITGHGRNHTAYDQCEKPSWSFSEKAGKLGASPTDSAPEAYDDEAKALPISQCQYRTWYYPTFDVSLKVKITMHLDIDFGAIYMAKYRGCRDYNQLGDGSEGDENKWVKNSVDKFWNDYHRNVYTMGFKLGEKLPFAPELMADENPSSEKIDSKYHKFIKNGQMPPIFAYGSAMHWQRSGDDNDGKRPKVITDFYNSSQDGWPVYFTNKWYSLPETMNWGEQATTTHESSADIRDKAGVTVNSDIFIAFKYFEFVLLNDWGGLAKEKIEDEVSEKIDSIKQNLTGEGLIDNLSDPDAVIDFAKTIGLLGNGNEEPDNANELYPEELEGNADGDFPDDCIDIL